MMTAAELDAIAETYELGNPHDVHKMYDDVLMLIEEVRLASNAFDVMTRRRWGVAITSTGWLVCLPTMTPLMQLREKRWADPFTALVEADSWYKVNVENKS